LRALRFPLLVFASLLTASVGATDLLSAMRLADTIVNGERRLAIIETIHGDQRIIAEGDSLGGCTVASTAGRASRPIPCGLRGRSEGLLTRALPRRPPGRPSVGRQTRVARPRAKP
jgi:hypothetical protein